MKKSFLLLNLSILCLFSSFSWSAESEVATGQQIVRSELNFPDYSPLSQRIANGDESVKAKVFYWIEPDGTIGSTTRGWRRVPKSSRHLVYLNRNNAEQALQESLLSSEERAQIEKNRSKEEMRFTKDLLPAYELYGGLRNCGSRNSCRYQDYGPREDTFPICVHEDFFTSRGGLYEGKDLFSWDGLITCYGHVWNGYKYVSNGDQYTGEARKYGTRNIKLNVQGTYKWASGEQYSGGIKEGKLHGLGTYVWSSGNKYVGGWRMGDRHGYGTITYIDGTIEEGFWSLNHLTDLVGPVCAGGYNAFTWHNCVGWRIIDSNEDHMGWYQNGQAEGEGFSSFIGSRASVFYEGNFKNGKRNGKGTITSSNGAKYIGQWRDNKQHGKGAVTFPNGSKYVGEFMDGRLNGQGIHTQPNGSKYVGEYKDDKRHGQGKYTNVNGTSYEGLFKNDEYFLGSKIWANGNKYVGEGLFKNDKYFLESGIWAYGKYVGEFKDFKSHGVGNFYRTDGSMMGGLWKNDIPSEVYSGYKCTGDSALWSNCIGTLILDDGTKFVGKFIEGKTSGKGTLIFTDNRPMKFAVEPPKQELIVSKFKGHGIGVPVQTKYFEVTVNSASFQNFAGDDVNRVYPGSGNKFLVINVTYTNLDKKLRTLISGEVLVQIEESEFVYSKAELILDDGYLLFDTLNPMVSRKGNIVFKVPEGLKEVQENLRGDIFYKPANSRELIYLLDAYR